MHDNVCVGLLYQPPGDVQHTCRLCVYKSKAACACRASAKLAVETHDPRSRHARQVVNNSLMASTLPITIPFLYDGLCARDYRTETDWPIAILQSWPLDYMGLEYELEDLLKLCCKHSKMLEQRCGFVAR